jgi:hypothetical protein
VPEVFSALMRGSFCLDVTVKIQKLTVFRLTARLYCAINALAQFFK